MGGKVWEAEKRRRGKAVIMMHYLRKKSIFHKKKIVLCYIVYIFTDYDLLKTVNFIMQIGN